VSRSPAVSVLRSAATVLAAVTVSVAVTACGAGRPSPASAASPSTGASASSAASPAAGGEPGIVAVTSAGALVTLSPSSGVVEQTLVPSGVAGDEVSVAPSGLVYFAVQNGCTSTIESVPIGGGSVAVIAPGSLPAVSPDGTKLAYASEPSQATPCVSQATGLGSNYNLEIRTLSSGATTQLPMLAGCQCGGVPEPISHLSWSTDNTHLAVSIAAGEDNEGWEVSLLDTTQAQAYLEGPPNGTGITYVPVTGPDAHQSYLREAVYMPNGDLFVSRACCAGEPAVNSSRLMWEVNTSGVLVHQVAIGFANLDHTSLDVSSDGQWLLYLAGNDLYVSKGGATPSELTTGLIAAAWVSLG
jgi:WD40-like Beta Propeller Repeat